MQECNKNYTILALDCMLKNSKRIILALGINIRYRNNNVFSAYEHFPWLTHFEIIILILCNKFLWEI